MTHYASVETMQSQVELIADPRAAIERERSDNMENLRFRLRGVIAGGGDKAVCASAALAVARFVEEGPGARYTDRDLVGLHIRMCRDLGLTDARRRHKAMSRLGPLLFKPD